MARTPGQRGRIGTWLVESRLARGYATQAKACEAIRRLTGWAINRSQYASWESGDSVPKDENLAKLEAFYGPLPSEKSATTSADSGAMLAMLTRLTDEMAGLRQAIEEQNRLTAARAEARDTFEDRMLAGTRLDRRYANETHTQIVELIAAVLGAPAAQPVPRHEVEPDAPEHDLR